MTSLVSDCLAADGSALTATVTELAPGEAGAAELAGRWTALEARAEPSFFCSWGWIGSWLAVLPPRRRRLLVEIADGGRLAALAVVVAGKRRLFRILPLPIARLHDSSEVSERAPTLEHNGLLVAHGREADPAIWTAVWTALRRRGSAELWIPYIAGARFALPEGARVRREASVAAPSVDLSRIERDGQAAERLLGRNGREQLRRARKAYQTRGKLSLSVAGTAAEAHDFLERLGVLHQATWTERGKPGSFADPFFRAFHRRLIDTSFASGEIELLRLAAGAEEVGYLYNFRYRDRIYAYQSGFRYEQDPRLKPGLVCHAAAIDRAAADPGLRFYDFLAGDSRFKRGFANSVETLDTLVLFRKDPLIGLENTVKKLLKVSSAGEGNGGTAGAE